MVIITRSWLRHKAVFFIGLVLVLSLVVLLVTTDQKDVSLVVTDPPQTDEQLRLRLELVKHGVSREAVLNIIDKPDSIIQNDYEQLLSRMQADEVWQYYHPEYATISALIAFRNGIVTNKAIWKVWGTKPLIFGEIETPEDYWSNESQDNIAEHN